MLDVYNYLEHIIFSIHFVNSSNESLNYSISLCSVYTGNKFN